MNLYYDTHTTAFFDIQTVHHMFKYILKPKLAHSYRLPGLNSYLNIIQKKKYQAERRIFLYFL